MEMTCKDCEWYEFYDGPKKNKHGDKAVMRCNHSFFAYGCEYHSSAITCSSRFTPKSKPAEKDVERRCKTCRLSCMNEGGCPQPETILCTPENSYAAWQPIEKPQEKRSCNSCSRSILFDNTCGDRPSVVCGSEYKDWQLIEKLKEPENEKSCDICKHDKRQTSVNCPYGHVVCLGKGCPNEYNNFEPIEKPVQATISPEEKKERDHQSHIVLLNSRLQNQKEQYQRAISDQEEYIGQILKAIKSPKLRKEPKNCVDCRNYTECQGEDTLIEAKHCVKYKLKKKEKTMSRLKKWIRRYVMSCTVYCTAIICIVLNPWVFKLWGLIISQDFYNECAQTAAAEIVLPWLFTFISIAAIVGAVIAFEKITAFVFGKLEK